MENQERNNLIQQIKNLAIEYKELCKILPQKLNNKELSTTDNSQEKAFVPEKTEKEVSIEYIKIINNIVDLMKQLKQIA